MPPAYRYDVGTTAVQPSCDLTLATPKSAV
jgi:hypothetical protein